MNMRGVDRFFSVVLVVILLSIPGAGPALAEEAEGGQFTRLGKWEAYGIFNYCEDDSVPSYFYAYTDLRARGTLETEVESSFRFGGGLGRTIHKHLNLNGSLTYGQVKLNTRGSFSNSFTVPFTKKNISLIKADTHEWTINLGADAYLFPDTFPRTSFHVTPMLTAGFGTKYFHGEWTGTGLKIRDYILTTHAGVGFRWDFQPFFTKVLYHTTWYRMTDNEDSYQCMGYTGQFGYAF